MPVTPCFDPTTGASGGAPAPAPPPSLYNLPMTEVDLTDGSWTLLDPDGLIDTVSFSGGYNLITFNAGGATPNHRWAVYSTTKTAPRWYKSLEIDGNQVTLLDPSWFVCRMQNDTTVDDFNQQNVFGTAADPTSTDTNVMGLVGGTWLRTVGTTTGYGVITRDSNLWNSAVPTVYSHANVMQGGNALGSATYLHYNNTGTIDRAGSRNTGVLAQAGTNRYLMVGVGINTDATVINAGDQVSFSLKYLALTFAGL